VAWVAAALALASAPGIPAAAAASPPPPAGIEIGGGDGWHAERSFVLYWTRPPGGGAAGAGLRLRDPHGEMIEEDRMAFLPEAIALRVPSLPGIYSAEVWLENAAGERGPPALAQLRFDDTRPGPVEPVPLAGWAGRTAFPLRVRLGHPSGAAPISGIRGYAVTIDPSQVGSPCIATTRCTDAETTLRGGAAGDTLTIHALPEGTSFLHAAAVSGSGMRSAIAGHAVLRVDLTDPVTRLTGAPPGWTNRPVSLTAVATDTGSGMAVGPGPGAFTAIRIDGGTPQAAPGASVTRSVIGEGEHQVAFYARDAAGNVGDGAQSNGIANRAPRTAWVRIDRTAPTLAFANSQDPGDPDLLRAVTGDPLSGPDLTRGRIEVRPAGSGDSFEPLPRAACPGRALCARWSSGAYPAGEYEFQATGYDAAGNPATSRRRQNGTPMVLSNPLKAATALGASLAGHPGESVPYGRGVHLHGRLTTGVRSPLAGMPVQIVESFAAGTGQATRLTAVRTAADGSYSVQLAPGPSREVVAAFSGSPALGGSASRRLRLGVRSVVRLRTSAAVATVGGAPLVFQGRVWPPREVPAGGKSVQLQFRLPGLPWTEFRTVQTGSSGRFRYAYRFSDDDSRGARFQFRAYASAQDDWPYEPGGSQPVIVRGR
jgi:hypothetical protein